MNKKTWTDEELIEAVKNNVSFRQTMIAIGLCQQGGGNYQTVRAAIKRLGVDTSHWLGRAHLKGKTHNWSKKEIPLESILVLDGPAVDGKALKRKILKANLLPYICSTKECGITHEWLGKKIILHIDHINGNHQDNRIENLRFLCPNCHSQTDTYCGKKVSPKKKREYIKIENGVKTYKEKLCCDCSSVIHRESKRCVSCSRKHLANLPKKTKIQWPSNEDLLKMLETSNFSALGKQLGVSDNAIRKRLKLDWCE